MPSAVRCQRRSHRRHASITDSQVYSTKLILNHSITSMQEMNATKVTIPRQCTARDQESYLEKPIAAHSIHSHRVQRGKRRPPQQTFAVSQNLRKQKQRTRRLQSLGRCLSSIHLSSSGDRRSLLLRSLKKPFSYHIRFCAVTSTIGRRAPDNQSKTGDGSLVRRACTSTWIRDRTCVNDVLYSKKKFSAPLSSWALFAVVKASFHRQEEFSRLSELTFFRTELPINYSVSEQ